MNAINTKTFVKFIIPCYNVEKYINRCLTSITAQTVGIDHIEVICVDDASTDGTVDMLKEWEKRYSKETVAIVSLLQIKWP